jgi:hypothetical protein
VVLQEHQVRNKWFFRNIRFKWNFRFKWYFRSGSSAEQVVHQEHQVQVRYKWNIRNIRFKWFFRNIRFKSGRY